MQDLVVVACKVAVGTCEEVAQPDNVEEVVSVAQEDNADVSQEVVARRTVGRCDVE